MCSFFFFFDEFFSSPSFFFPSFMTQGRQRNFLLSRILKTSFSSLAASPCLEKYHSSPSSSAFCIVLPSLVHATTRKTNEARCSTVIWSLSRTKAGLAIEIPWMNFQSLWENSMGDTTLGISPGYNSDAIHPPVFVTRPERKI